jgi:hypothetical protein
MLWKIRPNSSGVCRFIGVTALLYFTASGADLHPGFRGFSVFQCFRIANRSILSIRGALLLPVSSGRLENWYTN